MHTSRRLTVLALSALSALSMVMASGNVQSWLSGDKKRDASLAFAGSLVPFLRVPTLQSSFVGDRIATVASLVESNVAGLSMSCRRNLKKEKRARNEQMARQFRKAPVSGFARGGRGGGRAAAAEADNADSEWLSQIYGQHTIYRSEEQGTTATVAEAKVEKKERVTA